MHSTGHYKYTEEVPMIVQESDQIVKEGILTSGHSGKEQPDNGISYGEKKSMLRS